MCQDSSICSGSGCGCGGCQSPWPSMSPLDVLSRTHTQQEQRILGLCSSEPGSIQPTTSLENRMNSVTVRLWREGRLLGKTYYHLRSSAAGVPHLNGVPKVHKPGVPLRPIVSFVSPPAYALSKFLASLLSPIVGLSDSYVRSSQQFAQFITTQNVPDSEVLVSFNVVSLFTGVPTS